ncbi:MAG: hypothetical protein ABSA74_03315 [Candidatus Staskawiczbacteria bacterium]|jgi:hypothetical protein
MATLVDRSKSREFSLDVRQQSAQVSVVVLLARHSDGFSFGKMLGDIRHDTGIRGDNVLESLLDELVNIGLVTAKEQQIGTSGTTAVFYQLAAGVSVELVLKDQMPSTGK